MSYLNRLSQNVVADANNSSTANLSGGATFAGTGTSTLGVVGLQVSLKTDQNCTVYVEQSPDNSNWDISDTFTYDKVKNNFGVTVQAINSYVRVRVTNLNSGTATTYFRLQTALCPIVEAVPRSLSPNGNLQIAIKEIGDHYGWSAECTPFDELRVAPISRLVGSTFVGSTLDTAFWTATPTSGGTATVGNAQVVLATNTTANAAIALQSVRTGRYVGGVGIRFRAVLRCGDTGTANNERRWGIWNGTDGAYFKLSGTTFSVCTRKTNSETAVASTSWNKTNIYPTLSDAQTYEIYYTNKTVYFVINGVTVHQASFATTTWSDTTNLPIRIDNTNSAGSTSNVTMDVRVATICRLGQLLTQPTSYYHALGLTVGTQLKIGAGNLHSIVILNIGTAGGVITLSDSTSAATPVILAHTTVAASNQPGTQTPVTIDCKGLPFFNGLRLTVATQNVAALVIYE